MAVHKQRGVYIPDEPGRKHVPMVGPGISVWAIIDVSRLYDWDLQKVTGNWEGYLTEADVRAAWDYYRTRPNEIDEMLRRNELDDLDPEEWGLT